MKNYDVLYTELEGINLDNLSEINDGNLKIVDGIVGTLESVCLNCKDLSNLQQKKILLDKVNFYINNLRLLFNGYWEKLGVDETNCVKSCREKVSEIEKKEAELKRRAGVKFSVGSVGGGISSILIPNLIGLIAICITGLGIALSSDVIKSIDGPKYKEFYAPLLLLYQRVENLQKMLKEVLVELNGLIAARKGGNPSICAIRGDGTSVPVIKKPSKIVK